MPLAWKLTKSRKEQSWHKIRINIFDIWQHYFIKKTGHGDFKDEVNGNNPFLCKIWVKYPIGNLPIFCKLPICFVKIHRLIKHSTIQKN